MTIKTQPTNGSVSVQTGGKVRYTPTKDFNGQDSFVYEAADDDGLKGEATVTVTVGAANDPPAFGGAVTLEVAENTATSTAFGDPVTATDPDDGATLTYSLGGTDAASFAIEASTGQLKTKAALDHETKDSYSLEVSVSDGLDAAGETDATADATVAVTVTVTDVNEAPVAADDSATTTEDTAVDIAVLSNDSDPDEGDDAADLAVTIKTQPTNGSVSVQTGGKVRYTPTKDFNGQDSFVYEAADDDGLKGEATVTVTVGAANDPPAFGGAVTLEVAENTATSTAFGDPVTATDPDDGATLTYSLGGTDAASFAIEASTGQLKTKAALDHETKDSYSLEVSVSDGLDAAGETDATADATVAVTVTVTDVNEAPVAADDSATTTEDTAVDIAVLSNDSDPDEGDDAADLAVTIKTQPTNGSVSVQTGGKVRYTPTKDFNGQDSFVYEAADDDGLKGEATVTVTVTAVNDPPVVARGARTATREVAENTATDTAFGDPVTAEDPDAGATLTHTLGGVDAASFAIVASTGQLKTKAALDHETKDSYSLVVSVTDGLNADGEPDTTADAKIAVTVTVTDINEAPVAADDTATTTEGTAVDIIVLSNDDDPDEGDEAATSSLRNEGAADRRRCVRQRLRRDRGGDLSGEGTRAVERRAGGRAKSLAFSAGETGVPMCTPSPPSPTPSTRLPATSRSPSAQAPATPSAHRPRLRSRSTTTTPPSPRSRRGPLPSPRARPRSSRSRCRAPRRRAGSPWPSPWRTPRAATSSLPATRARRAWRSPPARPPMCTPSPPSPTPSTRLPATSRSPSAQAPATPSAHRPRLRSRSTTTTPPSPRSRRGPLPSPRARPRSSRSRCRAPRRRAGSRSR